MSEKDVKEGARERERERERERKRESACHEQGLHRLKRETNEINGIEKFHSRAVFCSPGFKID